jgi:endonuclease/exonuclease/phosphatase (EEP) superfamily protein YafD
MVVHPPPPVSAEYAAARDAMLAEIATWAVQQDGSVLVLGDVNCTPWSPVFRKLLQAGNLRDTRRGVGNAATWPSGFGRFGIPLDHALVRAATSHRRVLAPIGSDHLPIALDVH